MNFKSILVRATAAAAIGVMAIGGMPKPVSALTINYGSGSSSFSVMNVSNPALPATASVIAAYYPQGGVTAAHTQSYNVPYLGRLRVSLSNAADFPLAPGWQGSVVLSSDQDIVATAMTDYTGRNAFDAAGGTRPDGDSGTESSAYDAFNAGSTTLFAPLVQRVPRGSTGAANVASRVTIQNTTGETANVTVTPNREGTPLTPIPFTLPAYGSRTFDTSSDTDPIVTAGLSSGRASLVVSSTKAVAGVVEQNWDNPNVFQNWSGDYSMLVPTQKARTLYSAQAQRECRGVTPCLMPNQGGNVPARFNTFSSFTLQNTSINQTASVTAIFIPSAGLNPTAYYVQNITLTFTIQPQASFDINLMNGGTIGPSDPNYNLLFGPLTGKNFRGSLKVNSNIDLVGVGFFQQPQGDSQNYVSTYGLVTDSDASAKIVIPWVDRDCKLATACPAPGPGITVADYNSFTNIAIVNTGGTVASITSVQFFTQTGGAAIVTVPGFTLNPGASYFINTRGGGDVPFATMQALSEKFYGSAVINAAAGAKLKAVATINRGSVAADAYNANNR